LNDLSFFAGGIVRSAAGKSISMLVRSWRITASVAHPGTL